MLQNENFRQQLMQLFMQTDFDPSIQQYTNIRNKKFITDFDGVFEEERTEPLYQLFFKYLIKENSSIKKEKIDGYIGLIFQGVPIDDVFRQMTQYLRDARLTRRQYYDACKAAAEEWKPNPLALNSIEEIRDLGYSINIISGSPQEALEMAAQKIGISKTFIDKIVGTSYEFDIFGNLENISPMLKEKKWNEKMQIVRAERHVAVTDDMMTDGLITDGAALSVIVADRDEEVSEKAEQIYIFDKTVRRNFAAMVKHIKKYEYSVARSYRTSIAREKRILDVIQKIKNPSGKDEFLESLEILDKELGIFSPFSSIERIRLLLNYKNNITEKQKTLKQAILDALQELPEAKEEFAQLLKVYT